MNQPAEQIQIIEEHCYRGTVLLYICKQTGKTIKIDILRVLFILPLITQF